MPTGHLPPPDGYTSDGTIDLFGIPAFKATELYSRRSNFPSSVIPLPGQSPAILIAMINGDIRMSTLIPQLTNTPFDKIALKNPTITYQNYEIDSKKGVGFNFDCDVVFDESCGKVHDVLATVLGVKEPSLHLHCGMGKMQGWWVPLSLSSFTLEGTFADVSVSPCKGLTMTSVGVKLFGFHVTKYAPDGSLTSSMAYGFGVFGIMHVDVPGSDKAIELDFEIRESGADVSLFAVMKIDWTNALGVKNLTIKDVTFYTQLSVKSPMSTFSFSMEGIIEVGHTVASLSGSYSAGGNYSLKAEIDRLEWSGLYDIFRQLHGESLVSTEFDITMESASLTIASGEGVTLLINNLKIDKYVAVNGEVKFSDKGATIRAGITSGTLQFGEFHLTKAYVQISYATSKSNEHTGVLFGGEIQWQNFTLNAGVHLYTTPGKDGVDYTIYATFASTEEGMAFSTLIPALKGSFLGDVTLEGAALIVASQEDPEFGTFNKAGYPVHQGIQVCAVLGEIKAFSDLMHNSTPPHLTLSAGWSQDSGFTLDIILPTPVNVDLGRGITTDPFTLQVRTAPPEIKLIAGVKIPVPKQKAPLHFSLILDFNAIEGGATGQLAGSWNNPFGISPKITIGPNVALSFKIIFAQFITTGTPSAFGFVGGLQIGKVNAQVAFQVSENPSEEVLYAEVQNADINDIVSLTSDVTQVNIPQPPNFLSFEEVKLYVCPAGTRIGKITYPQGFSFIAKMVIFGKHADSSVVINHSGLSLKGGLDNLTIGALAIRGTTGPRSTVDFDINVGKQVGAFDGKITLYDFEILLHMIFSVMPKTTFHFSFFLKFTDHMTFNVEAHLLGEISNVNDVSNIDFTLAAIFHQDILDYIAKEINKQFKTAVDAEENELNSDKAKVAKAKAAMEEGIDKAKKALDAVKPAWDKLSSSVHGRFDSVISGYKAKLRELEGAVEGAKEDYKKALSEAESAVKKANSDRAEKMEDAQRAVRDAKEEWGHKIDEADRAVSAADQKMKHELKNAGDKIDEAKGKLKNLDDQIDGINREIRSCERAAWWEAHRKAELPVLYGSRETLRGLRRAAEGVLNAAKTAVQTGGDVASKEVLTRARQTLETTKGTGSRMIEGAEHTLKLTDQATDQVVNAAESTLSGVKNTGPQAIDAVRGAIDRFKNANEAAFKNAQKAIDDLATSLEYVAFWAAESTLSAAQSASAALDAANATLEAAKKAAGGILWLAEWIATHSVTLVNVREVNLSGQISHAARGDAMGALVKGTIAGKDFSLNEKFDPRHVKEFIDSIFQALWKDVQNGLIKL